MKQGIDEDKLMAKQNAILTNLQTSTSETATAMKDLTKLTEAMKTSTSETAATLGSLRKTTESMNTDVHGQLTLLYDPSLHLIYDTTKKKFSIDNTGRTSVSVFGMKYQGTETEVFPKPFLITPTAGYDFGPAAIYKDMSSTVTKGAFLVRSLEFYIPE